MKKIVLILIGLNLSFTLSAQVSKTINVSTPGTLNTLVTLSDFENITNLTLTGKINASDFLTIRDSMIAVETLDISGVIIEAYEGSRGTYDWVDISSYYANEIPYSAFYQKKTLKSIVLPESITSIAQDAFSNCKYLKSITIPSKVTTIGNGSFAVCNSLQSVIIPSSVTSIDENAFYSCDSLKSVTIPSSISSIQSSAFGYCKNLDDVILPSSVKSIGDNAFAGCSNLKNITIPSSVDSIAKRAFYECKTIATLTIPSSVKYIGEECFSGCELLQSVILPSSLTKIENYLFYYCSNLKTITIPSNVTAIGKEAFSYCTNLKSVTISNSVKIIGYSAFYYCKSLDTITIPSSVTMIENETFSGCDSLTRVNLPSSLKSIGESAFSDCLSLKAIDIPSSITNIQYQTFYNCRNLKTVTIPSSVDTIGVSAFEECTSLQSINLPSSITTIGKYAFYDCTGLRYINIPNAVDTIGKAAFEYVSLTALRSFTGPKIVNVDKLPVDTLYVPIGTRDAFEKSGNYDYKVIVEFAACVTSSKLITVLGQGIMPSISFIADTSVCPGQTVTMKCPKAFSYAWSTNETTQSITVKETGTYSVTVTAENGCTNTAKEHVTMHQPYTEQIKVATYNSKGTAVLVAWTPTKEKRTASYALQHLDDVTGTFKTIATRGVKDSTLVIDIQANAMIQSYSYRLITYDSLCHDSSISQVHETIHLSCSQSTNTSSEVQLSWNTYKGLTPKVFKVYAINNDIAVDSFTLGNNGNPTFQRTYMNHKPGNSYRIGFDLNSPVYIGTLKTDSILLGYKQILSNVAVSQCQSTMPSFAFVKDTTVCHGQKFVLKAPKAVQYIWNTKATSDSISITETGLYSVTITNDKGCTYSASEHVTVHQAFAEQIKVATYNEKGTAVTVAWTPTKGKQIARYALQHLDDNSGTYKTIVTRGVSDSTFFVDLKADATIQTYSYKWLYSKYISKMIIFAS